MTILEEYIVACTNLYGCVSKEKVMEIFNQQTDLDISDFDTVDIFAIEEYDVIDYEEYYVQEDVLIYRDIDKLIQSQQNKPYYVPNQEELLRYVDMDYFEITKEYKNLENYLKESYEMDNPDELDDIMLDIYFEILETDSPTTIIKLYEKMNFEIPDEQVLNELVELTFQLYNNTKRQDNNGYSPTELRILMDHTSN